MSAPRNPNALRRDPEYQLLKTRRWRSANPQKVTAQRKKNYASRAERYRSNPAYYLWRTARARAKQCGIAFEIDVTDICVPETCPITGERIDVLVSNYQTGASLDRVINSLGYVKGNVRVISRKANRMKGDATIEDLLRIVAYMRGDV
jgi:hypothetical protein